MEAIKKLILTAGLLIAGFTVFSQGFKYFDVITIDDCNTTQCYIARMTPTQRIGVIEAYLKGKTTDWIMFNICDDDSGCISTQVGDYFYNLFDRMEYSSDSLMVENDYSTQTELRNNLQPLYSDDFTLGQVNVFLNYRVLGCKSTKDGDWDYYRANVEL